MKIINFLKIVLVIIVFITMIVTMESVVNAWSLSDIKGDTTGTGDIQSAGNKVVQILSTVGSILSVIVIIVLGIKYMMGSVEEKAEYKSSMLPYLIGAAFIFCASGIAKIIYEFAIDI